MMQHSENKSIRDICRDAFLSRNAVRLIEDDAPPGAFIKKLVGSHRYADAIRFMAHSLPSRDAIWWSVLCVWESGGPPAVEAESTALRCAAQWVIDPTESHRSAAQNAGTDAGVDSPAICTARAAARVKDLESLAADVKTSVARMIAGAVLKTAARAPAAKRTEKYANLLAVGVRISRCQNHWQCCPSCELAEKSE